MTKTDWGETANVTDGLEFDSLVIEIYLDFVIWNLEFFSINHNNFLEDVKINFSY
jgi:hypothetical protein